VRKLHETATLLFVITLPNIIADLKKSTHTLSNKPFLIWLLTTPPHLKYVVTLPCNLSLMACFADINVSQSSVATYARCGGIFNIHLTANLTRNLPVNFFYSVKIWQNYGHECVARFFGLSCTLPPFSVPHQSVHRTQIVSIQGTIEVIETSSYRAVSCEIFAPRHMARASMIEKPPTFIVPISHHSSSDMVRQDISTCFSNCLLVSLILRTEPNKEDRKHDGKLKSMLLDWAVDTTDSGS